MNTVSCSVLYRIEKVSLLGAILSSHCVDHRIGSEKQTIPTARIINHSYVVHVLHGIVVRIILKYANTSYCTVIIVR